jgi:hypothetical protein
MVDVSLCAMWNSDVQTGSFREGGLVWGRGQRDAKWVMGDHSYTCNLVFAVLIVNSSCL